MGDTTSAPSQLAQIWGTLITESDEALFSVDLAWRFTALNSHAATLWGHSSTELLGAVMWEVFPNLIGSRFEPLYRAAMATGRPYQGEVQSFSTEQWYDLHIYPMHQGLIVCVRDVTTRKHLEQSLQFSEMRYRALSDATFEGVLIHDSGMIIDANAFAAEVYGYASVNDLIGQPIVALIAPESWEYVQHRIAIDTDAVCEYVALRNDGSRFPAESRAKRVHYHGQMMRIVAFRDATEAKRAEAQRLQMHKTQSILRLAAGIAHAFNNHLAVIMSSTQLAQAALTAHTATAADRAFSPSLSSAANDLHASIRATQDAAHLVHQLLRFASQDIPDLQQTDLNVIIHMVQSLILQSLPETITVKLALTETHVPIYADTAHVERVIVDLVTYARDTMPTGGTITIGTGQSVLHPQDAARDADATPGAYTFVSVTDTGPGIDHARQASIFEPFETVHESDRSLGLRLAIAFNTVKEHGGFMTCTSVLGQGTTFTMYFPNAT